MERVNAKAPRGVKYVQEFARWMREKGFDDLQKTRRTCSMCLATHWESIQSWLKTLSPARRSSLNDVVNVWRAYRTHDRKPVSKGNDPGWRGRRMIDVSRATAAIDAVKREAPELPADVACNVAFAVMRALGVAVPRELLSRPVAVAVGLHAVG